MKLDPLSLIVSLIMPANDVLDRVASFICWMTTRGHHSTNCCTPTIHVLYIECLFNIEDRRENVVVDEAISHTNREAKRIRIITVLLHTTLNLFEPLSAPQIVDSRAVVGVEEAPHLERGLVVGLKER